MGPDVRFGSVSIDTRTLAAGDLFVALRGPHFDGHGFLAEAGARGAVAALVERAETGELPIVIVNDTRLALGRFAAWWRARFSLPIAAITGSNGKTTTKEMLAQILSAWGEGVVTRGNLNNEIGVPLTLLRLGRAHRFAVVEMGAGRAGDIDYLSRIAQPDAAVVTNAGLAHLAGFGNIDGVARTKGEIFSALGPDGIAVINIDDPYAELWRTMAGSRRIIRFGMRGAADVQARAVRRDADLCYAFDLVTPEGTAPVGLRVPGRHNVMNALAAAGLAHALGATLDQAARGLGAMRGAPRRLQARAGVSGAVVIDDTYNANPGSAQAALELLADAGADRERWLVLGDMAELGEGSQSLHQEIGRLARAQGVDRLYALGDLAAVSAGAFGTGARRFSSHDDVIEVLRRDLNRAGSADRVIILVKGSRSTRMDRIADAVVVRDGG
jgi:UDP-N-acetylmuramoyl-tripeptide--D-alanyl-D-alanine ligase